MIENFKLKVFRVVADALNYRRAADELHLTQPAVTAQIRSLEESLGVALFDRIGRDTSLTPAGATLLQFVRHIESITNDAIAALVPFGAQEGVELSIGAAHTIAVYLLPRILPQLVREWTKLRIHVVGGNTNEILQSLTAHRIGIALIEAPAHRPDLKIEIFGYDELVLIVRPDHRLAKMSIIKAAELVHEQIILREVGSGMRHFVEAYLERNGILRQQLRAFIDINSTEGIISAVEAGLGVSFVPRLALESPVKQVGVRIIQLENGPIKRELSIALLNGPNPQGPVGRLLEILRDDGARRHYGIEKTAANQKPEKAIVLQNCAAKEVRGVAS